MIWLLLLHNLSLTMCVFLLHKNEMQFFGHYLLILKLINIMYESKLSFSLHFFVNTICNCGINCNWRIVIHIIIILASKWGIVILKNSETNKWPVLYQNLCVIHY